MIYSSSPVYSIPLISVPVVSYIQIFPVSIVPVYGRPHIRISLFAHVKYGYGEERLVQVMIINPQVKV